LVSGVFGFPKLDRIHFTASPDAEKVTPSVVYAQYQVPNDLMSTNTENRQAVAEFQNEFFSPSDLQDFFKQFMPNLEGQVVKQVVGKNLPEEPGLEPNLDVQYIMSTGPGVNMTVYNINSPPSIYTDFLEWVWDVGNDTSAPWVHSVSYGAYGGRYPADPVHRLDNEYIKLGMRGITILFASGDNGVGCSPNCQKFEPDFPSSPYVTMVGSTQLGDGSTTETGASFSAGGFSNTWDMPSWQKSAVESYLSSAPLPASHFFNSSGRAYPDLSSLGVNVQIVQKGSVVAVDGTSCSSPIVAGLISMLNEIRLNAGKPTLGFINPLLYQWAASNSDAFHDVVSGKNAEGCCPGFQAFAGWDPVTGLGSPNFGVWSQIVTQMD
jgi:tripeptidyl-peptidase-1